MELGTFVGIYFEDKKKELKPNSIRNKKQMIQKHILYCYYVQGCRTHIRGIWNIVSREK